MSHSNNLKQVLCQGCTQTDKDTLANNEQVWIRGKVYGKASFENNWKIFPLWVFRQWNSACVTANTGGVGYFRPEWKPLISLLITTEGHFLSFPLSLLQLRLRIFGIFGIFIVGGAGNNDHTRNRFFLSLSTYHSVFMSIWDLCSSPLLVQGQYQRSLCPAVWQHC